MAGSRRSATISWQLAYVSLITPPLVVLICIITEAKRQTNYQAEQLVSVLTVLLLCIGFLVGLAALVLPFSNKTSRDRVTAGAGLALAAGLVIWDGATHPNRNVYFGSGLSWQIYEMVSPADSAGSDMILIYLHGASGTEREGMSDSSAMRTLRTAAIRRNWIYVCPRSYELGPLAEHLLKKFPGRAVVLVGASRGGGVACKAIAATPGLYKGAVLLCPALVPGEVSASQLRATSLYIVCGTEDQLSYPFSKRLTEDLKDLGGKSELLELEGGGHGAPLTFTDWDTALRAFRPTLAM